MRECTPKERRSSDRIRHVRLLRRITHCQFLPFLQVIQLTKIGSTHWRIPVHPLWLERPIPILYLPLLRRPHRPSIRH